MKQTSVEWLFQQLWEKPKDKFEWYALLEKAKKMHKDEIISTRMLAMTDDELSYLNAEQYYNETFKKD